MNKNDAKNYWNLGDIRLRLAQAGDAAAFAGHSANSPEWVERAFDSVNFPLGAAEAERFISGYNCDSESSGGDKRLLLIESVEQTEPAKHGIESGGCALLGFVDVWEADRRNGVFRTGIKMVDGNAGKGFATRAYKRVLEYYFYELRYQKCSVYIYEFNGASLRFHKKFWFTEEGRLRREYYSGGQYYDSILLGLTIDEFSNYKRA